MNLRWGVAIALFSFFSFWMYSCEKINNDTNISFHGDDESHYTGENCMNCHYRSDGEAEGSFSLAGSFYGNTLNHSVRVFNSETGALIKTIEIDGLGNAFTTEDIDMTNGIRIDVVNEVGQVVSAMGTIVKTGQCNLCHDGEYQNTIILP